MKKLLLLFALALSFSTPGVDTPYPENPGIYFRAGKFWEEITQIANSGAGSNKRQGRSLIPFNNSNVLYTFHSARAALQIATPTPMFCVRLAPETFATSARTEKNVVIVQMDERKDHRELRVISTDAESDSANALAKDRSPEIIVTHIADGLYTVTPKEDLRPGEYLLTFGASGMTGFDFGYHPVKK